jgi:hypothetical protein
VAAVAGTVLSTASPVGWSFWSSWSSVVIARPPSEPGSRVLYGIHFTVPVCTPGQKKL